MEEGGGRNVEFGEFCNFVLVIFLVKLNFFKNFEKFFLNYFYVYKTSVLV